MVSAGWTDVMPHKAMQDELLPEITEGSRLPVCDLALSEGKTTPPSHLTEFELIGLVRARSDPLVGFAWLSDARR